MVGRTLPLNGQQFTVVGVSSEGFHGTRVVTPDVWVPVDMWPSVAAPLGGILTSRGARG